MDVLIVDDESLARQRLKRMLQDLPNCRVVGEAANGMEALQQVQALDPDMVLLDIRMPGMDGIEAGRRLAELDNPPVVIYCTAYDDYALAAFKVQAVDYLLKPISRESLLQALERARQLNRVQQPESRAELGAEEKQHLAAKSRRGVELIPVDEVRCLMADHKYVTVHYLGGEILIDDTLKELEEAFPRRFVRVHRNALVSLPHVEALERTAQGGYCLRVAGLELKPQVSRRHVSEIKQRLGQL